MYNEETLMKRTKKDLVKLVNSISNDLEGTNKNLQTVKNERDAKASAFSKLTNEYITLNTKYKKQSLFLKISLGLVVILLITNLLF